MEVDYGRYYQRYHNNSDAHRQWLVSHYNRIISPYLPETTNGAALDIGCGMGFAMNFLLINGFMPVEGIDIDDGQIKICQENNLQAHLVTDSVEYILNSGKKYQLVLALDVLEHMERNAQLNLTRAIYSALEPGGRFICSVPNANSMVASRQRYNDFTHHDIFTEESLDFLLYNSKFKEIMIKEYDFFLPPHRNGMGLNDFSRKRHYLSYLAKSFFQWVFFKAARSWRRIEMCAEFGFDKGGQIPLSINLLGVATKEIV